MRKTLQKVMSFYLLLFLLPILTIKLPMLAFGTETVEKVETQPVAYAANVTKEIPVVEEEAKQEPISVLLYFTHNHEAFHPILEKTGKKAVNYHPTSNITNVSKLITQHLELHGAKVDVLPYDNMKEMQATNRKFPQAYDAIRPVLQKKLAEESYDLVLDLHRDALPHKASSLNYNGESFARISLVVGTEHPKYKLNETYAKSVSEEVNRLIPGLSRGVIPKSGDNVDGVYNQDLSPHALLIEVGGQENNEEEINRTVAVIAKAVYIVFEKTKATQH